MKTSDGKVVYLDGIRGLAALFVFFHHFLLAFYCASYYFETRVAHLPHDLEIRFGKSIFSVFANGSFFVAIFFVLSGFVLSRKYFQTRNFEVIRSAANRRYLRLYIPVSAAIIFSFLLMEAGLYYNVPASKITLSGWLGGFWNFTDILPKLWHCLTVGTMFRGDSSFDNSMWTISNELYGSFFVFAVLGLTHYTRNVLAIIIILFVMFFMLNDQGTYTTFLFGILLNYVEKAKVDLNKFLIEAAAVILILLALMLGSYPAQSIAGINGTLFEHWPTAILQYCDWFVPIGACFFVLAFVLSPYLQRFISLRFFRFLGYISFCFYLLHPIVIGSFSSYLFLKLHDRLGYHFTVMVVFFLTVAVTFILSWLMTKFIDEKGVRFSRYVYERWFKKEAVVTALHREQ